MTNEATATKTAPAGAPNNAESYKPAFGNCPRCGNPIRGAGVTIKTTFNEEVFCSMPCAQGQSYEGWSNRETWAFNLWLSNDEGTYDQVREAAQDALAKHEGETPEERSGKHQEDAEREATAELAEWLKEFLTEDIEQQAEEGNKTARSMVADVGSFWRVEYWEVARSWIQDEINERERQEKKQAQEATA